MKDHLFQCAVSNVCHRDHKLIFRVLHEREILYLVVYDFGVFQVRLDALSLEKLEKLQVFLFVHIIDVRFSLVGSF